MKAAGALCVSGFSVVRDKENHWLCQWKQRAYSDDESKKKSLRFEVRKVFRPDLQQFGDYFMTNKKLTKRKNVATREVCPFTGGRADDAGEEIFSAS